MFQFIHREIVSGNQTSIVINSGLSEGIVASIDGNRDRMYLFRLWLHNPDAPSNRAYYISPNSDANFRSHQYNIFSGGTGSTSNTTKPAVVTGFTRDFFVGEVQWFADLDPGGGVNFNRTSTRRVGLIDASVTAANDFAHTLGSISWDNSVDNITSFEIFADDGAATPQAAIGDGSVIEVWRLQQLGFEE